LAPGTAFGAGGERFVRLCFARNPEQLEAAVGRVASVISNRV
jgi:aspartate/methionine/tyrosine aminotransferase